MSNLKKEDTEEFIKEIQNSKPQLIARFYARKIAKASKKK